MAAATRAASAAVNLPPTPSVKRKRGARSHDDILTPVKNTRPKKTTVGPKEKASYAAGATEIALASPEKAKKLKGKKKSTEPPPERRSRKFRKQAPRTFQQRLERATTQR
jgi:hypothetical protein